MRLVPVALAMALSACGVAETGTVAATAGALKAKEAERAKNVRDDMVQKLDQAAEQAARRREEAESAAR